MVEYSKETLMWRNLLAEIARSEIRYNEKKAIKVQSYYITMMFRYRKCYGLIVFREDVSNNLTVKENGIIIRKDDFYDFLNVNMEIDARDRYLNVLIEISHYKAIVESIKENRKQYKENLEYKNAMKALRNAIENRHRYLILSVLIDYLRENVEYREKYLTLKEINRIERSLKKEQ